MNDKVDQGAGGLIGLAERCEGARGPDRELDAEIALALGIVLEREGNHLYGHRDFSVLVLDDPYGDSRELAAFTSSLDAAVSLIPTDGSMNMLDVNFTWEPGKPEVWPAATVRWYPPHKSAPDWHAQVSGGRNAALAICAAALHARARALAQQGETRGE